MGTPRPVTPGHLACATGRHFQQVTLVLNRPGAPAGTPFMQYRLGDVSITSVSHSGSGSDRPLEKVSFQYVSIDQTYTTADGGVVESTFNPGP
jgi:type VI protein secretion system component Hcp